ncbi:helix-turn-helix domain-containing protein [Micromonospora coerulea]|uniref:helix-turn-helix domain-containing protein n=1 Tax=Micromonospora coerulea TaxID=47856 RepID=UPI001908B79B|nr:helix-turn-helix transcriptional regulator [Micromonospora veneta]
MSDGKRPSEVLGQQVRKWRERRGNLSAQGLANRIAEIGGTLSRVAISKIENGDRGVSLDEWLQLAHALAVPPPLLLVDLESGADVAVAPMVELHPWLVWRWVTGQEPPLVRTQQGETVVTRVTEYERARTAVFLYQHEQRRAEAVTRASSDLRAAEYAGDEAAITAARAAHADALRDLAGALDDMVVNDVTPPGMPRKWVETIRELEMSKYPDRLVIFEPTEG